MAALALSPIPPSSSSPFSSISTSTSSRRPITSLSCAQSVIPTFPISTYRRRKLAQFPSIVVTATKEENPPLPDPAAESESPRSQSTPATDDLTELGAEIKKAMQDRAEKGGEKDFWGGVAEEIGEIEWPAFGKVLGTTGVVLGVIAGSSVVLLTVNAVLTELSDKVFAGRGVQDFFG